MAFVFSPLATTSGMPPTVVATAGLPHAIASSRIARGVTFLTTNVAVTFDDWPRYSSGCKPAFVAIKR
jgi:hypothetical protein